MIERCSFYTAYDLYYSNADLDYEEFDRRQKRQSEVNYYE